MKMIMILLYAWKKNPNVNHLNYDWMIEKWMFLQWYDENVIGVSVWDDEWSDEDGCYDENNESPAPSSQGLSATKCARQIEVDGTLDPRMQRWAALRQDMLILEFKYPLTFE